MEIKYKETVDDIINAIKQQNKRNTIMFIICSVYCFIIGLILLFNREYQFSVFFLIFILIIVFLRIVKTKKAKNNIRKKYEYSFNNEIERTITIQDDKIIYYNNKTQAVTNIDYKTIKKVKINKEYIFLYTIFKEWIYIIKDKINEKQYTYIVDNLKNNNILIKGK